MAKHKYARIALNLRNSWNSSYFCPDNSLLLTRSNPIGVITKVTPGIIVELVGQHPTLIDLEGKIDVRNRCFMDIPEQIEEEHTDDNTEDLEITRVIDESISTTPVIVQPVVNNPEPPKKFAGRRTTK